MGLERQIAERVLQQVDERLSKGWSRQPKEEAYDQFTKARGESEIKTTRYAGLKTQKALAVCVKWRQSTLENLVLGPFGGSYRNLNLSGATQKAMFECEKFKARSNTAECECALLAKNMDLVLEVPDSFLERVSRPGSHGNSAGGVPPAAPMQAPTASSAPQQRIVPFAASWQGVQELISGRMTYSDNGRGGTIRASLSGVEITCSGTWQLAPHERSSGDLPWGTWSLACTNGEAASGRFQSEGPGRGVGEGEDARGRRVTVRYGS